MVIRCRRTSCLDLWFNWTIVGFIIYYFGFSRIAKKNVKRIVEKRHKFCVFAFISWKSYLTILVMVAMGIGLRMSPLPKHYLAVLYIGLGIGLGLSSFVYFGKTILHFREKEKHKTKKEQLQNMEEF